MDCPIAVDAISPPDEDLYRTTLLPIPVSREIRPARDRLEARLDEQRSSVSSAPRG